MCKELFASVMSLNPSVFMLLMNYLLKYMNFKALQNNKHHSESIYSVLIHLNFSDINLCENFTCHELPL